MWYPIMHKSLNINCSACINIAYKCRFIKTNVSIPFLTHGCGAKVSEHPVYAYSYNITEI